jgi:hypothetical protein
MIVGERPNTQGDVFLKFPSEKLTRVRRREHSGANLMRFRDHSLDFPLKHFVPSVETIEDARGERAGAR